MKPTRRAGRHTADPDETRPFTAVEAEDASTPDAPAPVYKLTGRHVTLAPPPEPHGVARAEVLAAIIAQARAQARAEAEAEANLWPAPVPLSRTPALVAKGWISRVIYPAVCDSSPERYAAAMRRISAMTGTTSLWERPAAWHRHEIETRRPA